MSESVFHPIAMAMFAYTFVLFGFAGAEGPTRKGKLFALGAVVCFAVFFGSLKLATL